MLPQPLEQRDSYLFTTIQNKRLYILNGSSISRAVLVKVRSHCYVNGHLSEDHF